MSPSPEFPKYRYNPVLYNSDLIRGQDVTPPPYNIYREILTRIPPNGTLLDVGCGSAARLIPLTGDFETIFAIDKNHDVIKRALHTVQYSRSKNIHVSVGNGDELRFPDGSMDMVTYMLSPHNAHEALRVLKNGGFVIAEQRGEQDKSQIKTPFHDSKGNPRGYWSDLPNGEIARRYKEEFLEAGFRHVSCQDMFWETRFTKDGLWLLLKSTRMIKDFDQKKDRKTFEDAWSRLASSDGIVLTQHRVLMIAQKLLEN